MDGFGSGFLAGAFICMLALEFVISTHVPERIMHRVELCVAAGGDEVKAYKAFTEDLK